MEDYLIIFDAFNNEIIVNKVNIDYIKKEIVALKETEEIEDNQKVLRIGYISMISGKELGVFVNIDSDIKKANKEIKRCWGKLIKELKK